MLVGFRTKEREPCPSSRATGSTRRSLSFSSGKIRTSIAVRDALAEPAIEVAKENGFEVEVFDEEALRKLNCGGWLAVNAGSAEPLCMIKLVHHPTRESTGSSRLWRRAGCTGFGARLLLEVVCGFGSGAREIRH